jgi:iron complex transport system substrate-binding protein
MTSYTPRRIVSLQPSATVIIDRLGRLDAVVACTRYCAQVCPGAATGRLIVSDSWTAQAEEILAAQPDLVIAAVPYQEKALAEILKAGVRFLGLAPRTLADIYGDIAAIAGILGLAERGAFVIGEMKAAIASVAARTSIERRPRVYCEEWGKPLIASQPWVAELVEAAGGAFVGQPGQATTAEQVRKDNPEVIIAAWCGAGERVPLEKIICERQWSDLPAARAGSVFCVSDELLNTPAPTLLAGLRALGHAIHPDLFPTAEGIRAIASSVL